MAISTLQRLASQTHRLPSLSSQILTRSSATLTSSSTSSKKVSDRIVKLFAIDPEGQKREVIGLSGQTLLRALINSRLIDPDSHRLDDIDACSAECEVNIAQEWLERLPPRTYDEEYVLVRNSRGRILNKHSRLGCQVLLTHQLQGMDPHVHILAWYQTPGPHRSCCSTAVTRMLMKAPGRGVTG